MINPINIAKIYTKSPTRKPVSCLAPITSPHKIQPKHGIQPNRTQIIAVTKTSLKSLFLDLTKLSAIFKKSVTRSNPMTINKTNNTTMTIGDKLKITL